MSAHVQETKKSLSTYLPIGVAALTLLLIAGVLWPRFRAYRTLNARFVQEQGTVRKIQTRWESILRKERYYRKIYANLEELTKKVGNPKTDVDYMRFFIDRSRSKDFRILSFRQLGEKSGKNRKTIAFSLSVEGQYAEIARYLYFLENAYPLIFLEQIQIKRKRGAENTRRLLRVQLKGKIVVLT